MYFYDLDGMIKRILQNQIENDLFEGKAILVFGPRQTGKSTLIETILKDKEHLYLNGDDADVREILTNTTATELKKVIGDKKKSSYRRSPACPQHWPYN